MIRRKGPWVVAGLLLLAALDLQAREVVRLPEGDVEALKAAIEAANESGEPTTIKLRGSYPLGAADPISISGDLELLGGELAPGSGQTLFHVRSGGRLLLSTRVSGFGLSRSPGSEVQPLLENSGTLIVQQSRFERIVGRFVVVGRFGPAYPRVETIVNHGTLEIDRTSFLDVYREGEAGGLLTNRSGRALLTNIVISEIKRDPRGARGGPISNLGGTVRIVNGTLASSGPAVSTAPGATTYLANTIIGSPPFYPDPCIGRIVSLGHNLVEREGCELDGPGDLEGISAELFPLRIEDDLDRLPVIALSPDSPAIDSASQGRCRFHPVDIRGTRRVLDGCDRGAFEAIERPLAKGGVYGVFHVPNGVGEPTNTDGHYLSILDTVHGALVVWSTFDRSGNQAWVFGTGEIIDGRSVTVAAYTNEGGILTEMGAVGTDLAISWGTLQIELKSCNRGRLVFDSSREEFGAGEFPIRRLAETQELGCSP